MSATAGWYPDPGGQPGLFRYWDGRTWSATTTTNPQTPPPGAGPGAPGGPSQPAGQQFQPQSYSGQQGGYRGTDPLRTNPNPYAMPPQRKKPVGWIAGGLAVVAVVVLVVVLIVRSLTNPVADPSDPTDPGGGTPSQVTCPDSTPDASAPPQSTGARVTSGKLSYPRLGAPFGAPQFDSRVPFGREIQTQNYTTEASTSANGGGWQAGVLIARLLAGDGFYGPEQGSKIVVACILGKFYGDNPVKRDDKENKATTVDGHDAWIVESHLTFDIPGIKAKGETMIVVVISVSEGEGGLFYASIPDTNPELVAPARNALKNLQVA